jgi:hypothetical protein
MNTSIRATTKKILAAMDDGLLTPQQVAEAALRFLSEDDVAKMAHNEEFFSNEDDEDEDDDAADVDYDNEDELADEFDNYICNNGIELTRHWELQCEDGGINTLAEEIAEENLTTINQCIAHFCR